MTGHLRGAVVAALVVILGGLSAAAEERQTIGVARAFTNDLIGNGGDRWRTGSYTVSILRGPEWQGYLGPGLWDVVEYRFRTELIAPRSITNPAPGDRLFVGALSFGTHLHFQRGGLEVSAGADLVALGEQTGLRSFQAELHDIFDLPESNVEDYQVENGFYLHGTAEIGRDVPFAGGSVRPFVELQGGVETMARLGVDLTFGSLGDGGLLVRDHVTGYRLSAVEGADNYGLSFLLGADAAYVESSRYLPESRGYEVEDLRYRIRAGMNYGLGRSNLFYGLTYLSEEFEGQPTSQTVGSLTLAFVF